MKVAIQLEMTKKYRQCGKCGQVIEKIEGCTHMTCTCGNYFCYSCGEPLNGGGEHQCQTPQHLNCIQGVRWQIEHIEFWYESHSCTLLRVLLQFSPPARLARPLKWLWILFFSLTLYPLLLLSSFVLAVTVTGIIIGFALLLSILVPFLSLCGSNNLEL